MNIATLTGVNTGGAAILSYHVEYDHLGGGMGPFTEVAGFTAPSLLVDLTVAALTPGQMYYFRYRAKNIHGWSPGYSPIRAILLATVP